MDIQTKKCPLCAETIPLEAAVCEYCGARFAVTIRGYCAACHEIREADAGGLCTVCGMEVADRRVKSNFSEEEQPAASKASAPASTPAAESARSPLSTAPPPTGKKKGRTWAWILGAAILAVFCCASTVSIYWVSTNSGKWKAGNPFTAATATSTSTSTPSSSPTPSIAPEPVRIRWLIGIASGTDPAGNDMKEASLAERAVSEFNASHPGIQLILEKVPSDTLESTLTAEIAAGNGPDITGPFGISQASKFHGQWLDLAPYIQSSHYDASAFSPALVAFHHTDEGQLTLPFELYPAAIFYQKELFDRAGLKYPPASYGESYTWPDGTTSEWNYDTLAEVAKRLTIDSQGRNATENGFSHDQNKIVQYGFIYQWTNPTHTAGFWSAGKLYQGGPGNYSAVIPEQWKSAWRWYYEGMWGPQLFIPSNSAANNEPLSGNPFNSGKIAMTILHTWYACCVSNAGEHWDLAALPSYSGAVHGVIHADSFYVWKNTQHPAEAFDVLAYLVSPGSQELLVSFIAMPSATANQDAFFSRMAGQFPWVTNWKVFQAGLNYLDVPSVDYLPNYTNASSRLAEFDNLLGNNGNLDVDAEIEKLRNDLRDIFNQ
jgi:multiple sugar transport system substrate-binding protein